METRQVGMNQDSKINWQYSQSIKKQLPGSHCRRRPTAQESDSPLQQLSPAAMVSQLGQSATQGSVARGSEHGPAPATHCSCCPKM